MSLSLLKAQILISLLIQKLYDLDDLYNLTFWITKAKQQAASQQYICQNKIQYIIPNTFTNKEYIAHKDFSS